MPLLRPGRLLVPALLLATACSSPSTDSEPDSTGAGTGIARKRVALLHQVSPASVPGRFALDLDGQGSSRGPAFTSPGWRAASQGRFGDLAVGAPATADGRFEIGVGRIRSMQIDFSLIGARSSAGELVDGTLFYPEAFHDTDLLVSTATSEAEQWLLLRSSASPRQFAWSASLPPGVASVERRHSGLWFLDSHERLVLHVANPFVVGADHQRHEARVAWDETSRTLRISIPDSVALSFPALLDPSFESAVWVSATPPPPRILHAMAYHPELGRVVAFGGGETEFVMSASLWSFDGASWRLHPSDGVQFPQPRNGHAMAYDHERKQLVVFGGYDGALEPVNDTWTWDGISWVHRTPSSSPPALAFVAMADDPVRKQVVLFGGRNTAGNPAAETWTWDGVTWQQRQGLQPPARQGHAMAWDPKTERIVAFGGAGVSTSLSDTWTWDGSSWQKAAPSNSPSARRSHAMATDTVAERVVLHGGRLSSGFSGETWTWDGADWTLLAGAAGPSRENHAMAFDRVRNAMVLFGGGASGASRDTWVLQAGTWVRGLDGVLPAPQLGAAMVYDAARDTTVLFGNNQTWTSDGKRWTKRSPAHQPSTRAEFAMTYDAASQNVVLFGGRNGNTWLDDTWVWDGTDWQPRVPTTKPGKRTQHSMAFDAGTGRVIMFGGVNGPGGFGLPVPVLDDTWVWDGVDWKGLTPSSHPEARTGHHLRYDPVRKTTLLFGGMDKDMKPIEGTWTWDDAAMVWEKQTPATAPLGRFFSPMIWDDLRQKVVLFGGSRLLSTLADTWGWDGQEWSPLGYPGATAPPQRYAHAFSFHSSTGRGILFGGVSVEDLATPLGDQWYLYLAAGVCSSDAQCSSGNCVDGVCCESRRCGTCQACNTPAAPGRCAPIANQPDPDSCAAADKLACDGASQCRPGLGAACSSEADCGIGSCVDGVCCESAQCGTCAACNTAALAGRCMPVIDGPDPGTCEGGFSCSASGECRSALGKSCNVASDCASGACVDKVCCSSPACGFCQACDLSPGTCSAVMGKEDPDTCASSKGFSCDAKGQCLRATGAACSSSADCASGACVDGVCCSTAACGSCEACNLAPSLGACSKVKGGGDADSCRPEDGKSCDAQGVCLAIDGSPCSTAQDCASGACTEGTCCDSKCDGACQSCVASIKQKGADGTCGLARRGTNPGARCQQGASCNESGACEIEVGPSCSDDRHAVTADGNSTDCFPYRCVAGQCPRQCSSVDDCVSPTICSLGGFCVEQVIESVEKDSGCGCRTATGRSDFPDRALWLVAIAALTLRRRCRRDHHERGL